MNSKGFTNVILVVVVVLLIGAVGYFVFVKKSEPIAQQLVSTQATTPKDETANWNIYDNEEYGFEINYPPTWGHCSQYSSGGSNLLEISPLLDPQCNYLKDIITIAPADNFIGGYKNIDDLKTVLLNTPPSRKAKTYLELSVPRESVSEIEFAGNKALKMKIVDLAGNVGLTDLILVIYKNKPLAISYRFGSGVVDREKEGYKILSTFKFRNQTSTIKSVVTKPIQLSINVVSPGNGEIWRGGSMQTVKWVSNNMPSGDFVTIILKQPPPFLGGSSGNVPLSDYVDLTLVSGTPNDQSEDITLQGAFLYGDSYRIEVRTNLNGNSVSGISEPFSIR